MPSSDPARLVVMASGSGTNLQAILDACGQTANRTSVPAGQHHQASPARLLDAEVVLVIANDSEAYALQRAAAVDVATTVLPHEGRDRTEYDKELAYEASLAGADLVVLAGWNRLLTSTFLAHHTVINLHPAKPGAFPGLGAIEAAFAAWQRGEVTSGGVMVHYVPDEGVDDGPVIAWEEVPLLPGDTLDRFEDRVHQVEHRLLVESIGTVLAQQWTRT